MVKFDEIYPMIREEFQKGSSKEEAIRNICRKRGLNPPSLSSVYNWLDRIHTNGLKGEIDNFHYSLLCAVTGQYLKFTNAIFHQINEQKHEIEIMLDDRILLVSYPFSFKFALVDTFTGELRSLRSEIQESELLQKIYAYHACYIGQDRILIEAYGYSPRHLLLLKIDFDSLTYSILHERAFDFIFEKMLLDSEDNSKFAITAHDLAIYKGHIADDRIHFDEQRIEIGVGVWYCKLSGGKLLGFRRVRVENEEGGWQLCEYDLSGIHAREVNVWPIAYVPLCPTGVFTMFYAHVWSKSKLYVSPSVVGRPFSIVVFDFETRRWAEANLVGIGYALGLDVDDEDALTLHSIENIEHNKWDKTIYHFPMRKPDKLRYLAWATIRRGAMFSESDLYEKLFPRLPYNCEFRSPFEDL